MTRTQYIFTYGTLQDEEVQQAVYGRILRGKLDELQGFKLSEEKLMGKYPVICSTESGDHSVVGQVYNITNLELYKTDAYETHVYKRVLVRLISGKQAWTYIENSD